MQHKDVATVNTLTEEYYSGDHHESEYYTTGGSTKFDYIRYYEEGRNIRSNLSSKTTTASTVTTTGRKAQ
jgi:hypothetical protein